jgi:predicted flap endonuclease-1-like 5' DNA nuclease
MIPILIIVIVAIALLVLWWLLGRRQTTPAAPATRAEPTPPMVKVEPPAPAPKADVAMPTPAAEVKPSVATPVTEVAEVAVPPPSVKAPAVAAEAVASPTAAPEPPKPDDLTIIEGIGPKISALLQVAGIVTFAQLAATDVARLREIMLQANLRIADPTTWPEQAALAAVDKWDDLKALQGSLKGGRRA